MPKLPDTFDAIAHPARRKILDLLRGGPRPVKFLAGHFTISRPAISQHLRILLDAGVVQEDRIGRERHYRLARERLVGEVHGWLKDFSLD